MLTTSNRVLNKLAKNSRYIYLYKIRENYEPLCFKNEDEYTYLLKRDLRKHM